MSKNVAAISHMTLKVLGKHLAVAMRGSAPESRPYFRFSPSQASDGARPFWLLTPAGKLLFGY